MTEAVLRVLVTGANGFIGRNLCVRLSESPGVSVSVFVRGDDDGCLPELVRHADAVVHLAGENRPACEDAFAEVNARLTGRLCDAIRQVHDADGQHVPLVLASSVQAEQDSAYGRSKRAAEELVRALNQQTGNPVTIFRFPGVFGKWCRPNYNSVVATFCHNIARGLPAPVHDPAARLLLVYIDDVVEELMRTVRHPPDGVAFGAVKPVYATTVGDLAAQIEALRSGRVALRAGRVGTGFTRALYATYASSLPTEDFSYGIPEHRDARGNFVEMLKTADSGQFSFFTALPGVTRGGHYHHTKTEKFLVIRGEAYFRYRHLLTNERIDLRTSGTRPVIVESIPGWSHDITNVGDEEMIVMLWANEVFDPDRPDTISSKV